MDSDDLLVGLLCIVMGLLIYTGKVPPTLADVVAGGVLGYVVKKVKT